MSASTRLDYAISQKVIFTVSDASRVEAEKITHSMRVPSSECRIKMYLTNTSKNAELKYSQTTTKL
jgi:hypothetical protein